MEFLLDQYLGCFGGYRRDDPICRRYCALNLRCAIEYEQLEQFEILEELVSSNSMVIKIN
jgi:hypothetical protein